MLNDVNTSVSDGLLASLAEKGDGVHVKIGASPVTSSVPITITGSMTAEKIKELLGLSPLADKVIDSVENGSNLIYCIPVAATTAGTVGTVTKTGTGLGSLTASGSPNNAFNVVIKINGDGRRNTAIYSYSLDGGYSFSGQHTVPVNGLSEISNTGIMVTFVEGTGDTGIVSFNVGDTFAFSTTAPAMTNSNVLTAIDKLQYFDKNIEIVHIVGESTVALWSAVSQKQSELATKYHKPLMFVLEAYAPNANEIAADYVKRLTTDSFTFQDTNIDGGRSNTDIQVVAARALYKGLDGATREINTAGIICGLYSRAAVQTSIGKTSDLAGLGISKKKMRELRPAGIEKYIETLDTTKYLTFRPYDGLPDNYYVTNARVMSPTDSDFNYAEDVRVKNKIIREVRKEALQYIQDDIDLEDIENELETRASFIREPLDQMIQQGEISSAIITVLDCTNFLTDGIMPIKIRYVSRGYIREIDIDLGRTAPSAG